MQSLKYSSCEPGERLRNGTQPALKEDRPNFRIGSIATELDLSDDVRFSLDSDQTADIPDWQLRAKR